MYIYVYIYIFLMCIGAPAEEQYFHLDNYSPVSGTNRLFDVTMFLLGVTRWHHFNLGVFVLWGLSAR